MGSRRARIGSCHWFTNTTLKNRLHRFGFCVSTHSPTPYLSVSFSFTVTVHSSSSEHTYFSHSLQKLFFFYEQLRETHYLANKPLWVCLCLLKLPPVLISCCSHIPDVFPPAHRCSSLIHSCAPLYACVCVDPTITLLLLLSVHRWKNVFTCRVSRHGRCHVCPWLIELSGVALRCVTFLIWLFSRVYRS